MKSFNFTTDYLESQSDNTKENNHVVSSKIKNAVKFMLPVGGFVLDTLGVDDMSHDFEKFEGLSLKDYFSKIIPTLALPYPSMNFEFFNKEGEKFIIHATQEDKDSDILLLVFSRNDTYPFWLTFPYMFKLTKEYETRTEQLSNDNVRIEKLKSIFSERIKEYEFITAYVVLDFLSAINCNNIKKEVILAPKFINSKRKAKGKPLFSDYHVLTLDVSKTKIVNKGEKREGSHTPKRQHLRRGHIRVLASGEQTWVRQCTVGNSENGFLNKDYWVKN